MRSPGFQQIIERATLDEAFAARLRTDLASLAAEYKLTDDEHRALLSRDSARLRALGVDKRITEVRAVPDIFVVGAGVRKPGQFTLEGVEALRRCRAIYSTLGSGADPFVRELAPRFESIVSLYRPGRLRSEIYARVATMVLEAADRERPIGFVTDGNPILFNDITDRIIAGAGQRALNVRILPGVSSIDTVLVDLKHDIAVNGLQIFGASRFVVRGIEPRVDVPCLLVAIGVLKKAHVPRMNAARPGELAPLQDHLLRFYPPEHELTFIESPDWWYQGDRILRLRLGDLGSLDMRKVQFSTLFIPRLPEPVVASPSVAAQASDPMHPVEDCRPP